MSPPAPSYQTGGNNSNQTGSVLPAPPDAAEPPAKRRKVPVACTSCRDRKTRCDGQRPSCSTCQRRGIAATCLYEEGSLKTQRLVWALEEKLRQFDELASTSPERSAHLARALQGRTSAPAAPDLISENRAENGRAVGLSNASDHNLTRPIVSDNRNAVRLQHPMNFEEQGPARNDSSSTPPEARVTAGDALATTSPLHGNLDCLYGASSTIAFVRYIFQATKGSTRNESSSQETCPNPGHPSPRARGRKAVRLGPDLDTLPRHRVADNYMRCYWLVVHPVFPILHKPSFEALYNQLWEAGDSEDGSDTMEDPVMLSILNMVFANGCLFSDNVEREAKSELADQFYQRSRRILPLDAIDSISIPTVQSLLLTGIYLQSTQYSSRSWHTVGMAIRAAQSLGLHLDQRVPTSGGQLAREMRRRIWHICVTLDRLLSMVYGRPSMIPQTSKVPLPLMIDDEDLLEISQECGTVPVPPEMGLFIYSTRLFEILDEVLCAFYSHDDPTYGSTVANLGEKSRQQTPDVLRLNAKLDAFFESIPEHLRLSSHAEYAADYSDSMVLQARVLNCRFLYVRLLLLRPVLLSVIHRLDNKPHGTKNPSPPKLEDDLALKMCQLCLDTAHSLIALLTEGIENVYRCSAWYTVYFTFGAVIILAASQLCPALEDESGGSRFHHSWTLAMGIFEHYTVQTESASHAMQTLKTFRQCLSLAVTEKAVDTQRFDATSSALTPHDGPRHHHLRLLESDWRKFPEDPNSNHPSYQVSNVDPDPLTEEWFSQQVLNLDYQDFF